MSNIFAWKTGSTASTLTPYESKQSKKTNQNDIIIIVMLQGAWVRDRSKSVCSTFQTHHLKKFNWDVMNFTNLLLL